MRKKIGTNIPLPSLLTTPINKLDLSIKSSPLEKYINRLYKELELKKINFKPRCYLTDEWGCPQKVPVIGIPFYLADLRLRALEKKFTKVEAENSKEIMMFLRHETGHALNYAYKLYLQKEWKNIFGLFSRPYKERYRRIPGHSGFVRHLPDWYAQKHPDEDFAETFAVWLTPRSNWQKNYKNKPAYKKLSYIKKIMRAYGREKPFVFKGDPDRPLNEIKITLSEWYKKNTVKK